MDPGHRAHVVALLDFYVAAGIDIALDEEPHDRFAETAADAAAPTHPEARSIRETPRPQPDLPAPSLSQTSLDGQDTNALVADVRARAAEASTLDELRAMLEGFEGCALRNTARQLVFADGAPGSRVMLLGEAPGAEEDRSGRPFVGRAGQLLDRMLEAIGLDRTGVYIANIVPWRPPGNRTPTPQEVAVCLPFTLRQIELARPEVLVTLGAPSTQTILGVKEGITRLRGRWHEHRLGARTLRVLPMLHPAYLLRQPLHKRFAWRDLRLLREELDGSGRGGQL